MKPKKNTSWNSVATWYDKTVTESNSFQQQVILPNLLRIMAIKDTDTILEVGCGSGFFTRHFADYTKHIAAFDIAPDLVAIAKKNSPDYITYFTGSAPQDLQSLPKVAYDKIAIVLALQNIEKWQQTIAECNALLKPHGELFLVLNHPYFRIHNHSFWHYDEVNHINFRQVDAYLSPSQSEVAMNPSKATSSKTISFHHSLQDYIKCLSKNDLWVSGMEEWISHKPQDQGPIKTPALEKSRKEIPMFMMLKATKVI